MIMIRSKRELTALCKLKQMFTILTSVHLPNVVWHVIAECVLPQCIKAVEDVSGCVVAAWGIEKEDEAVVESKNDLVNGFLSLPCAQEEEKRGLAVMMVYFGSVLPLKV